jgi:hypothetical protein
MVDMSCSFCAKVQKDVKKLIAGQNGVFICDECIGLCAEIVKVELGDPDQPKKDLRRSDDMLSGRTTLTGVAAPPVVVDEWVDICLRALGCRLVAPHTLEYEMIAAQLEINPTFVAEVPDLDVAVARMRAYGEFSGEVRRDLPDLQMTLFKNKAGNEAVVFTRPR